MSLSSSQNPSRLPIRTHSSALTSSGFISLFFSSFMSSLIFPVVSIIQLLSSVVLPSFHYIVLTSLSRFPHPVSATATISLLFPFFILRQPFQYFPYPISTLNVCLSSSSSCKLTPREMFRSSNQLLFSCSPITVGRYCGGDDINKGLMDNSH